MRRTAETCVSTVLTDVRVAVGAGETTIYVPEDVTVAVDAEMRAGLIDLFGVVTEGRPFVQPVVRTDECEADGRRLQLHIDNGVGEVTVVRVNEEL